jgi:hypothetical protein
MTELTFHGCFSRFAGDASEPIDFLSNKWTKVRNKKRKGEKENKILILSCNWKIAKSNASRLEVAPKEQFAYHIKNKQELKKNKKPYSKISMQLIITSYKRIHTSGIIPCQAMWWKF